MQLEVVELPCTLRELEPGQSRVPDDEYDLLLMDLRILEPLVDMSRLLGENGVIPSDDPYISLALRRLEEAENWKEARERLSDLHRLLHNELTLLPLWQMTEHFAYHNGMRDLGDRPVHFYQDVEDWHVVPPEQED
jgi:hypothetical protein